MEEEQNVQIGNQSRHNDHHHRHHHRSEVGRDERMLQREEERLRKLEAQKELNSRKVHHHHHKHKHKHHKHAHEHHHHHEERNIKKQIVLVVITAILLVAAYYVETHLTLPTWQLLLVYLVPYLVVGHHTIGEAIEGLAEKEPFNENLLMTIATAGALAIGFMPGAENEFMEAVFVMLFFQIGEIFEGYAEGRSKKSISHLMDIRPDVANVVADGEVKTVSPDKVTVGSTILVRPGEKIPVDGVVVDGNSSLNTVALTGESMPREVQSGCDVVSGCINLSGVLTIRTTKSFGESTVSKIIDLVENASKNKSYREDFITRFARVYTPVVVVAAVLLAFVPPALGETFIESFPVWLHRALIFLVVSCPCALVISVPLTFFGGIGGASRRGILIKGANFIDMLADVDTVVFDKTGTLTNGTFTVTAIHPADSMQQPSDILHLAAVVERHSTHPIAVALREADAIADADDNVSDYKEIAGHGIKAVINGEVVGVGNILMMETMGVQCDELTSDTPGTIVYVARGNDYLGCIVINDTIKGDSYDAIEALKKVGVRKTIMFTGDREEVAMAVSDQLSLSDCYYDLLPQDKVKYLQRIMRRTQHKHEERLIAFVGDGINDAPVLARADIGIAMGGMGSDAAIEAADVVLMNDTPSSIATAIRIARRTIGIARQNVVFAIGVKVAVLILAAIGLGTMWMAVFADVGVTVLAVLNAMRALRTR